ncbi:phosphopentomutase [Thermodesulfobacteriota bacterium]
MISRIIMMILDSAGVGALPDAYLFDDEGANTLQHIAQESRILELPNLCSLGLGRIVNVGCGSEGIIGCYGKMNELSPGKDTTTGHWEISGIVLDSSFPTFPDGFPREVLEEFEKRIGTKTLGNYPCSGTDIIKELGQEHLRTGYPIIYTSADSVFQIAAHVDVIPLSRLYEYCVIAREILKGPNAVGRVIARPFKGPHDGFYRDNSSRKDFSLIPPEDTLLDILKREGLFVVGIGKIGDIFGHRGLTEEVHSNNNNDGINLTIEAIEKSREEKGLIFVNLVDFDMIYGHRRDVKGYAEAFNEFDRRIPELIESLSEDDALFITADHGCDPTHSRHTDHTREYVPLMVYGKNLKKDIDLGTRKSFADCGQSIAELLGVGSLRSGKSFKGEILDG